MKDLTHELEQATEGSRELDVRIAVKVGYDFEDVHGKRFSQAIQQCPEMPYNAIDSWHVPNYTTSLDAARSLSNWVLIQASDIAADGLAFVELGDPSRSPSVEVHGIHANLVLAWCVAALKAREQADG